MVMSKLRNRLAGVISAKADTTVPLSPYQVLSMQTADVPVYTDLTVRKAVREGYKISGDVYRCVREIVQAISGIPWVVLDKDGEVIPNHDFAKVWAHPNKQFSGQDNMELIVAHQLLVGNSLIQPIIVGSRPREFWVCMPDLIHPIPSSKPGEWLAGYQVTSADGTQRNVPPEQFIHFMLLDPGNLYWGVGPLQAAARTVDTDNEAQDTQKISMQNRGIPDGVFEVEKPSGEEDHLTPEQYEEADRRIKEHYLTKEKRRMPWVIAGGKWHQMSLTPAEMDFIKSRLSNKRDIAGTFGISSIFLGDMEHSSYANMAEARKALYQDVGIPMLDDIKSTLNLRIAPMYGEGITISYDVSKVLALREDHKKQAETGKMYFDMGVPFDQINEKLEMGFSEFPGWDRGYLPLNLLPTGSSGLSEPAAEGMSKALNMETEEQKTAHWKRIDRRRVAWWQVVAKKVLPLYEAESAAVAKALKDIKAVRSKAMTPRDWEEAYSENPPHWAVDLTPSLFAQEFTDELTDRVFFKSLLEIGCGNGRDSIFFARGGLDVTAIDVAPSAIKLAQENAEKAEVSINFKVANAEKLPFDDGQFESVFSLSVLHATDLQKSMPEVNRVLKKDGLAFVYIYGDTQFADGKRDEVITEDGYLELAKGLNFTVLDIYTEQEKNFDEFGEKHLIIVSLLKKAGEPE